jgi:hypothetical protein
MSKRRLVRYTSASLELSLIIASVVVLVAAF